MGKKPHINLGTSFNFQPVTTNTRFMGMISFYVLNNPSCMKIRMGRKPTEGREFIQLAQA